LPRGIPPDETRAPRVWDASDHQRICRSVARSRAPMLSEPPPRSPSPPGGRRAAATATATVAALTALAALAGLAGAGCGPSSKHPELNTMPQRQITFDDRCRLQDYFDQRNAAHA